MFLVHLLTTLLPVTTSNARRWDSLNPRLNDEDCVHAFSTLLIKNSNLPRSKNYTSVCTRSYYLIFSPELKPDPFDCIFIIKVYESTGLEKVFCQGSNATILSRTYNNEFYTRKKPMKNGVYLC